MQNLSISVKYLKSKNIVDVINPPQFEKVWDLYKSIRDRLIIILLKSNGLYNRYYVYTNEVF